MKYHVFDPTGNITVLIEGERDISAADAVMKEVPDAEQVGFVTDGGLTLTMAGGEFCGNASMCAAVLYREKTGVTDALLSVSGADSPVRVSVSGDSGEYFCTVEMPPVLSIEECVLQYGDRDYTVSAVRMQGICHLIMTACATAEEDARAAAQKWCDDLSSDAVGLMFFDSEKMSLKPLVFVKTANTLFWENSCASGTSAVGAYLAWTENKTVSEDISEPGGILHVKAFPDGKIMLSGKVKRVSG